MIEEPRSMRSTAERQNLRGMCLLFRFNFALFHALDTYKDFNQDWESAYLNMTEDYIFPNTFKTLREFNQHFSKEGTKPEFEIYDVGMINNLAFLIDRGHVKKPVYLLS